jgi:exonuclease SbcC
MYGETTSEEERAAAGVEDETGVETPEEASENLKSKEEQLENRQNQVEDLNERLDEVEDEISDLEDTLGVDDISEVDTPRTKKLSEEFRQLQDRKEQEQEEYEEVKAEIEGLNESKETEGENEEGEKTFTELVDDISETRFQLNAYLHNLDSPTVPDFVDDGRKEEVQEKAKEYSKAQANLNEVFEKLSSYSENDSIDLESGHATEVAINAAEGYFESEDRSYKVDQLKEKVQEARESLEELYTKVEEAIEKADRAVENSEVDILKQDDTELSSKEKTIKRTTSKGDRKTEGTRQAQKLEKKINTLKEVEEELSVS